MDLDYHYQLTSKSLPTEVTMRIILTLLLIFISSLNIYSYERVVLAEIFTSTTCPPCASQNPFFHNWYKNYSNKDRVAVIKYHVWWPSPGNDPFYWANTTENAGRTNYYGTNYVPRGIINGTSDGASSASTWITLIQNSINTTSQFEVKILGNVDATTGGNLTIQVKADNNPIPSGTLVLHVAVVESDIYYTGTNGDPVHHFVMRKMYPNHNGEVFTINPNETKTFTRSFSWNSQWKIDNSHIVAFIQNRDNRQVYQAAIRKANIFVATPTLIFPPNASLNQPTNITLRWNRSPQAVRYGLEIATDSTFEFRVFADTTIVDTFRSVTKLSRETHYYWRVRAIASFGSSEWSNIWSFKTLPNNPPGQVQLVYPAKDTVLVNPDTISFGWMPAFPDVDYYRFELTYDSTFTVTLVDTTVGNNWINIYRRYMHRDYYWRVTAHNGVGFGPTSEIRAFQILISSVENETFPNKFVLHQNYPNPFNPSTIIKFNLPEKGFTTLKIYDVFGKEVSTILNEYLDAGSYEIKFSFDNLKSNLITSGIYFYQLKSGKYSETRKMIFLK